MYFCCCRFMIQSRRTSSVDVIISVGTCIQRPGKTRAACVPMNRASLHPKSDLSQPFCRDNYNKQPANCKPHPNCQADSCSEALWPTALQKWTSVVVLSPTIIGCLTTYRNAAWYANICGWVATLTFTSIYLCLTARLWCNHLWQDGQRARNFRKHNWGQCNNRSRQH